MLDGNGSAARWARREARVAEAKVQRNSGRNISDQRRWEARLDAALIEEGSDSAEEAQAATRKSDGRHKLGKQTDVDNEQIGQREAHNVQVSMHDTDQRPATSDQ